LHRIKLFVGTREDVARISLSWALLKTKAIAIANDFLFLILIWGVIQDYWLLALYKSYFSVIS